jgi:FkbM family methyltransferase
MRFLYTNYPKQYGQFLYLKNRLLTFPKLILLFCGIKIYLGSKNQDKWVIEEIFQFKKFGYFVDLAATNGLFENNTFILEKKYNWKGVAIEPNKKFFNSLKKIRKCIVLNDVILSDGKNIKFIQSGPTGGIIGKEFDNNFTKRSNYINQNSEKIFFQKTKSLSTVLKEINAPKEIDYLSLDVEGAETSVMNDFSFKDHIFLSMTIERPSKELNKLLFKNDYIFIKNYKADSFYLHKKLYKKIKNRIYKENFTQIPPKKW